MLKPKDFPRIFVDKKEYFFDILTKGSRRIIPHTIFEYYHHSKFRKSVSIVLSTEVAIISGGK